jgi:long-chain acyl-CoA synthetase
VTANLHAAGLHPAAHAATAPDRPALVMSGSGQTRTYRELDEASTRLALVLRDRGMRPGDHVAVLVDNEPAFFEAVWAGLRSGLYVTPINWHLTAAEAGYIVADCGATALVASARLADVVGAMGDDLTGVATRLLVGAHPDGADQDGHDSGRARPDGLAGFASYEEVVAGRDLEPLADECEGAWMFYSSGTTGRPKGIVPPQVGGPLGPPAPFTTLLTGLFGFDADTVYLSPTPLYHTAPAGWTTMTQRVGGTAVVMERFDPLDFLAQIERHRVTHTQVVPTHMIRLLKLPEGDRARFDLSSLRLLVHAAAPCPVEVKRAAIEWLGPIVHEFYSGTEGSGFCYIAPEDWLDHPGSVGRSLMGGIHILGEDGEELPAGEEGQVWFETAHRFAYHGDPDKTSAAWDDRGWSTLGDVGHIDDEGYLYLTDRASNMIISGGVNIYPREVEDQLVVHPAVADVAVLGTPDADWGEQVTAFVQPVPGVEPGDALAAELVEFCRARLSHFKCPREVRFVDELPRLPTGKLLKRLLV